jgi:hypothetical protein
MKIKLVASLLAALFVFGAVKAHGCTELTYGNNCGRFFDCEGYYDGQCDAAVQSAICEVDYCEPNTCPACDAATYAYCIHYMYFCFYPGCRNLICA